MRHFFSTALLVASLAGHVYGHRQASSSPYDEAPVKRRKTLGFGAHHPHAVYHATPYTIQTNGFTPQDPSMCPMKVARIFIDDGKTYKIRDDSYTDKNTGVTHVYARQVVNGLEVVDGDMNINIKDGVVISYGNSFYPGSAPAGGLWNPQDVSALRDYRLDACNEAQARLDSFAAPMGDSQVVMGAERVSVPHDFKEVVDHNCQTAFQPPSFTSDDPADFRPALLHFMHTATPNAELSADIENRFQELVDKMVPTPVHHFAPTEDGTHIEFTVDNVPDAVNPVPNQAGDATELQLVWKFEVEMQDNWYDATVSAQAPHKIVSVVDWASDSPIPKPDHSTPAEYNVFKWGINDPSVGERSTEKENFDSLASPAGWHALPYANDPQSERVRRKGGEFWRNTTTTWGNNVFAQENWEGANSFINNYRPDGGAERNFDFKYKPKETEKPDALEEAKKYINTTVSQLFYTTTCFTDNVLDRYGFDEEAGNFQQYNFGRGGREKRRRFRIQQRQLHDPTRRSERRYRHPRAHSRSLHSSHRWTSQLWLPRLGMGRFPRHHYPCQQGLLGLWYGSWAANRDSGIRNYIYSLNTTTLDKPGYWGVHAIGEVWAEMLWVVSQRLIEKHGYSDDLFPPQANADGIVPEGDFYRTREAGKPLVPKHGLVLNGMKLQPCRPTFFQARDAIISADQVLHWAARTSHPVEGLC
ncbi:extracellular elastinolytic metallo proteinase [Coprinopsis sp. MPI-PUGE-AT-0042]|nr:extracellular elastinolytic metallo proteinase [Coprinopsis sp. MPI-PUGE-AT-0042]